MSIQRFEVDPIFQSDAIRRWVIARHTLLAPTCLTICVCLVLLTGYRAYRDYSVPSNDFDWTHRGLSDFHNGTYYPTLAFRNGDNPYAHDVGKSYPMGRSAPLFSPFVFILHLPFSYLSLQHADVAFFIYNSLLLALLAYLAIRFSHHTCNPAILCLVMLLIYVSRPGHITLFTGYFTAELALGTAIALHFSKTRPALAGLGLLLASGKPNFILPLMLLMLFRRDFRAVVHGVLFCGIGAGAGIMWLASFSSLADVVSGFQQGQEALYADPTEIPFNTWTRVDLAGMAAKLVRANPEDSLYLIVMFVLLCIPGTILWRKLSGNDAHGATGASGMIICLSILLSIYHQSYDCLIVAVPWVGFTLFGDIVAAEISPRVRAWVVVFTAVPAANYLSTLTARNILKLDPSGWIWQSITLISGVCLLAALVALLIEVGKTSSPCEAVE